MLRPKLMKEWVIWQINNTQINIEVIYHLQSSDVRNALDNIHKNFVVVPIDKTNGNIALFCKISYAFIITRELGLNNDSSTDTYNNAGGLPSNDIIDKSVRDLRIKFGIDNISIKNLVKPIA